MRVSPSGLRPIVRECERSRFRQHRETGSSRRVVENIIPCVALLFICRQAHNDGRTGADRVKSVVIEVELALPVVGGRPAVAAVVDGLVVSAVLLDQDVPVDKSLSIFRCVANDRAVLAIDEIEISISALDPIVPDNQAGGSIFEIHTRCSGTRRAESVVLECDIDGCRVVVVLKDTPDDAVAENVIALD